ncbi:unnamed protein product, partial [Staurois parvus]
MKVIYFLGGLSCYIFKKCIIKQMRTREKIYKMRGRVVMSRGGLTIWKLGHCLRAREAAGSFFIGFFELGQGHRGPMIPYGVSCQ